MIAEKWAISREDLDAFAYASHSFGNLNLAAVAGYSCDLSGSTNFSNSFSFSGRCCHIS